MRRIVQRSSQRSIPAEKLRFTKLTWIYLIFVHILIIVGTNQPWRQRDIIGLSYFRLDENFDVFDAKNMDVCSYDLDYFNTVERNQNKGKKLLIHFIFGIKRNFGGKPFAFFHYISILSAYRQHKHSKIFLHYVYKPTTFWWSVASQIATARKLKITALLKLNIRVEQLTDVIRLNILNRYGGLYLDIDVILLSFSSFGSTTRAKLGTLPKFIPLIIKKIIL